ncbi:adenylate/guanylate cyclase domain-containing protein [Jatrophihabitans sp.]|uniref:adenylate/guanylate cyclase domain-containing protein n=1 Tax=Jatrophihabitans sp. TaxID=1932789 RepID=UPI0030C74E84|nr:family 3 adenylate cyclase [Jatrophihabitans sp.]
MTSIAIPPVSYADTAARLLAWQSWGAGATTIIDCGTGPVFSLDDIPDEPHWLHYMAKLAEFARVLVFDYPGTGLSDKQEGTSWTSPELSTVIGRVLDAADVDRAVVMGAGSHSPAAVQFAVDAADRVEQLILLNPVVRFAQDEDFPDGVPPDVMASLLASVDPRSDPGEQYEDDDIAVLAPSQADDAAFRSWWVRSARRAASPVVAGAINRMVFATDIRPLLDRITASSLVVQRRDLALFGPMQGRHASQRLTDCRYVELDGADMVPFCGAASEIVDEIREFLTGDRYRGAAERAFAVVLFTDIAGSTALVTEVGDQRWREIQHLHHDAVSRVLARYGGRLVQDLGDGTLSTFSSPGQALRAALAIREAVRPIGVQVKCGLHAGEVELRGEDVAGITVHVAARVAGLAGADEILVSSTMSDLVAGAEFAFTDRGEHEMKGAHRPAARVGARVILPG